MALTQPPAGDEAQKRGVKAVMLNTQSSAESLKELAKRIDAGGIKPLIGRTYPLAKAAQMWSDARTQHIEGKLVLTVVS